MNFYSTWNLIPTFPSGFQIFDFTSCWHNIVSLQNFLQFSEHICPFTCPFPMPFLEFLILWRAKGVLGSLKCLAKGQDWLLKNRNKRETSSPSACKVFYYRLQKEVEWLPDRGTLQVHMGVCHSKFFIC